MAAVADTRPPGRAELFQGFLILGLTGFGGVLPMARHMVVERRRWMTAGEFSELLSLCQFLPGGNIINMSVAIGMRFQGVPGALAAFGGLIAAPTAIVVALGAVYARYSSDPHVVHMFAGLAAAAAGILISMAIKLALPLRRRPLAIAIALLIFGAIAILHLPLVPTLLVAAPCSILAMAAVRG
ncbi:MAG TPA: chromate transporter [Reyranella sp.]|jgi:chromate transporter|nr:chromate transporter [Reyranella sp.]